MNSTTRVKILFTAGTTKFLSLIKSALTIASNAPSLDITVQCVDLSMVSDQSLAENITFIERYPSISWVHDNFDVVVSHAGAGTIYNCLENRIPLVVFPNIERVDKHQNDICNYLEAKKFALVARDAQEILQCIIDISKSKLPPYINDRPFDVDKLIDWIGS